MTWKTESFTDVDGNKDREFVRFLDLPGRTRHHFELAINGPQDLLREHGWPTVDAMSVSRSLWDYREFIQGSRASSASPSTRMCRGARDGSATGPSATWPPDVRRSCRTRGGARTCRRAPA